MTIQQAASSLYKSLQGDLNFFSLGVADKSEFNPEACLIIYLKDEPVEAYPFVYEGYPVRIHITGGPFMTLEAPRSE